MKDASSDVLPLVWCSCVSLIDGGGLECATGPWDDLPNSKTAAAGSAIHKRPDQESHPAPQQVLEHHNGLQGVGHMDAREALAASPCGKRSSSSTWAIHKTPAYTRLQQRLSSKPGSACTLLARGAGRVAGPMCKWLMSSWCSVIFCGRRWRARRAWCAGWWRSAAWGWTLVLA